MLPGHERPRGAAPPARGRRRRAGADPHRARRRGRQGARPARSAPTTTSASRSTSASCAPASTPRCAASACAPPASRCASSATCGSTSTAIRSRRAGKTVPMTAREFALLAYFLRNPERALDARDPARRVWRTDYLSQRTIDNFVGRLRAKFEPDPGAAALLPHRARRRLSLRARQRGGVIRWLSYSSTPAKNHSHQLLDGKRKRLGSSAVAARSRSPSVSVTSPSGSACP